MKKRNIALWGIILLAVAAMLYSCNKEGNEMIDASAEDNLVEQKTANMTPSECPFYPHFKYRSSSSQYSLCNDMAGSFCGFDVDDILNGDEECWLIMNENIARRGYMSYRMLNSHNAGEAIDSARKGAITFHADVMFLSEDLVERTGTDLIPAGRYKAGVTSYHGDSVICVYFDTSL